LLRSEKRSLFRFLLIYLTTTFILFSAASWLFYISGKHQILDRQSEGLKYEAEHLQSQLRVLHHSNARTLVYPNDLHIRSAIYDADREYIFGSFAVPPALDDVKSKERLTYIEHVEPYFLGAAYLLISKKIDMAPIEKLQHNIFLFMLIAGLIFVISGYYLGRLFVAPMRDSLKQMNRFIQDTTHELNTPISTILTNIEMIETFGKHEENSRELKRIEIASKTLSRIYDDLTYLNLNHQYHREPVTLDIGALVEERMIYFATMTEAKKLGIIKKIDADVFKVMDKNDALRLVDNLLSNAIKYNKTGGTLEVRVNQKEFSVKDTGIGIKKNDMQTILERFRRVDNSEGGFGIGLDIVNQVARSYGATLKIDSKINKGTEVCVLWGK